MLLPPADCRGDVQGIPFRQGLWAHSGEHGVDALDVSERAVGAAIPATWRAVCKQILTSAHSFAAVFGYDVVLRPTMSAVCTVNAFADGPARCTKSPPRGFSECADGQNEASSFNFGHQSPFENALRYRKRCANTSIGIGSCPLEQNQRESRNNI